MVKKQYDMIVIGAGSGMPLTQFAATRMGLKTALVEKGPLGGTCLNRGCIPSKMLIHSADIAETIRQSSRFGVHGEIKAIDFEAIVKKTSDHIDRQTARMEKAMEEQDFMDYYKQETVFTGPDTLRVGDVEISGKRFVVAAGCRPFIPPIKGLGQVNYWTSTEALRPPGQPETLIIIGGGYIAVELAHFYGALGTDVTVLQRSDYLLSREDRDVSRIFTDVFSRKYRVITNATVEEVAQDRTGHKKVVITDRDGEKSTLRAEALLVATGLQPNTDILDLQKTDMELDERGYVKTDEYLATTQKGAWALGDIVGTAPFKHAANREADIVAHNLVGDHKVAMDYSIMPHAIFSLPQTASVGLTEQEVKALGIKYEITRFPYTHTAMGEAIGADEGFVKYIIDEDERILGCHILGPHAAILIHEVIVAMVTTDRRINGILSAIHIHPSLSEVIQWGL